MDCITVDDWVEKIKKTPSLMKIDIEGAECRALFGARKTLEQTKGLTILLEVHHKSLGRFGDSEEKLFSLIKELGYKTIFLYENELKNKHYYLVVREKE